MLITSKYWFLFGAVVVWLLALPLAAQETATLAPSEKMAVSGYSDTASIPPDQCDAEGNVYVQGVGPQKAGPLPVTKISEDGKAVTTFRLDSVPDADIKKANYHSYALDADGDLFALVETAHERRLNVFAVKFKSDGTYDETVELKTGGRVFPYHLAVFPGGGYLLSGIMLKDAASSLPDPYTAVFDRSGNLGRVVTTAHDTAGKEPNTMSGSAGSATVQARGRGIAEAVGQGQAVMGIDGNAYLILSTSPPVVDVISEGGNVLRRMVLQVPRPGLRPMFGQIAGGRLVIPFARVSGDEINTELFSVYDTQTGDHLIDYAKSPELRGAFACYYKSSPDTFLFTAIERDGQMTLVRATP